MSPLETRLAGLAAAGQTMTYGALARDLGWRIGALTAALEALMEVDFAAGRPLRAALCEGRLSHGLPAPGFFQRAVGLGCRIDDAEAFVAATRTQLFRDHAPD